MGTDTNKATETEIKTLNPRFTQWVRQTPTPKQQAFLLLDDYEEVFFGGSGGGGKSSALLMAALQYADIPGYSALILRRTFTDLSLAGALIDRSHEWFDETEAKWNDRDHTWTFPCSEGHSVLAFGFLKDSRGHFRYRSSEWNYIGFDELTEFEDEGQYVFLRSRLRRLAGSDIPLRIRAASNPGGPGHEWVKRRFIKRGGNDTVFVPARLYDNPHIDQKAYEATLMHLPPILREQILEGNWDVSEGGKVISRLWFKDFASDAPNTPLRARGWDLAASTDGKRTAGVLMSRMPRGSYPYEYCVEHALKGHWLPGDRDDMILQQARIDDAKYGVGGVTVLLEQEPGSGGVAQNYELRKKLRGHSVFSIPVRGERSAKVSHFSAKVMRAGPFASAAQAGSVGVIGGDWNDEYLDELHNFPEGKYSDQVDATSLCYNYLSEREFLEIAPKVESSPICECGKRPHEDWCDVGFEEKQAGIEKYDSRDAGKIWRGE